MKLDLLTKAFIREHGGDDLSRLLLSASRYPEVDMPFVVDQIAARRQIRDKLPSWYAFEDLIYPSRLSTEQCSSEQTARYKQRLMNAGDRVCDLTGGLGVDSFYLSQKASELIYIERYADYAEAARHNMRVLGAENITVRQGDAVAMIEDLPAMDLFYIDPARRGTANKRLFALADCEPDLPALLPELLRKAPRVIAKISPMADISQTLKLLPQTTAVHVLSVRNECKELLFVIDRAPATPGVSVSCVDFNRVGEERTFCFRWDEEPVAQPTYARSLATYLFEPHAALMKAGAFKSIAVAYGMEKLSLHSHLYTADRPIADFPGRVFAVAAVIPFQSKALKSLSARYPKANITVRNFPLTVEELRKRTGIREGGEVYLFATQLSDGSKCLVEGKKCE